MPSVKKIIEKMRNQPNDIRFEEADKVLNAYGYILKRQRGSHKRYTNVEKRAHFTLVGDGKIKKAYIEDILDIIDEDGEDE